MQDSFGRNIDYLRLSVTDRCNLRCRYCMPEEGVVALRHDEILSYEELLRIAAAAVELGVSKIRVTGGEPLVRRGIVNFVAQLAALPGHPEIVLTTNGLRLADLANELKSAGLSRVNVSLDTLQPERFRSITRHDGLTQVLAGLAAAERAGLTPIKLNMVPLLGINADEIGDFARLTFDSPWEVRFIEFMPISENLGYSPDDRCPAPAILEACARVDRLVQVPRLESDGPARIYQYLGATGRIGLIPAVSNHFCAECNRLRVTADGRIKPCLFSDDEIDLRALLRAGADDSLLDERLLQAVATKPQGHTIANADFVPGQRRMHGIGG